MKKGMKTVADFVKAVLSAIGGFGFLNFVVLILLCAVVGTFGLVDYGVYRLIPIVAAGEAVIVTYVDRENDNNLRSTAVLEELSNEHKTMMATLAIRTYEVGPPVEPASHDGYDAKDRADLWEQHTRDLQRIDDLNKRLRLLEKRAPR